MRTPVVIAEYSSHNLSGRLKMKERKLGTYQVSEVGLGCMAMSGLPPERMHMLEKRDQAISTIHAALDAGVTLFDTADIYAPTWNTIGHNEVLLAEAFRTWGAPESAKGAAVIATKGGITRGPSADWFGIGGRNASEHYLYRAVEASAARLGRAQIQLWQHHRLDPSVTFEAQFENVMKLKAHGYVENIGLSNVNISQLERAVKMGGTPEQGGIVSVQNEWSPRYRHGADVRAKCEELGIAFLPWSPLGGIGNSEKLSSNNYGVFDEIAAVKGISVFALTLAWHLATSTITIPIPGATRPESILDTIKGVDISLTQAEIDALQAGLQALGPIHPELVDVNGL
jgi:aryl-alcohol dehydrogenase-like predicted oxidoreductase